MRILGIDYGERRVGLALSDPTGMLAGPLDTLVRRPGKRPPVHRVAEIARKHEAQAVVLGLPLGLDGEENDWCLEIRSFGQALAERVRVPVYFEDERLTSVMAQKAVRASGIRRMARRDKSRVDRAAAVLILQRWLDRTRNQQVTEEDE